MWTATGPAPRAEAAAAGQAAARPPARLRGVLDLRVRGGVPGRAGRGDRVRVRPGPRRPRLVALQPGRALLQQPAPVERRAVHGAAGHPPVGQVLDGRLARPPGDDLDHRRRRVRGLGRGVLHRLPVAAELRLAVDLHQRQGRVQLGRGRRILQRDELRPDADVAHRARPDHPGRHRRRARAAGPGARGGAPDRHQPRRGGPQARAGAPAGGRGGRCPLLARPEPPLRHPEGRHDRHGDHPGAHLRPGRRAVLPGRAADHHRHLGPGRARRLPGHRGQRAQRDQRDRHLRPAVQQPVRQRAEAAVLPADLARGHPAGQRGAGLRDRAADHARAAPTRRPPPSLRHLPGGLPRPAAEVGQRLRQRGDQGEVRQRQPGRPARPTTGRSRR